MTEGIFVTSDLALAAYLHANRFIISEVDRSNPKRVNFMFENSKELEEAVREFWSNHALVDPLTYYNAMKSLKTRIYQ